MAKRQGREEPTKIEQGREGEMRREPQVKQTASMLDQFTQGRLRKKKKTYKGSQELGQGAYTSSGLLGWHALQLEDVFFTLLFPK